MVSTENGDIWARFNIRATENGGLVRDLERFGQDLATDVLKIPRTFLVNFDGKWEKMDEFCSLFYIGRERNDPREDARDLDLREKLTTSRVIHEPLLHCFKTRDLARDF